MSVKGGSGRIETSENIFRVIFTRKVNRLPGFRYARNAVTLALKGDLARGTLKDVALEREKRRCRGSSGRDRKSRDNIWSFIDAQGDRDHDVLDIRNGVTTHIYRLN
jgi:hypothetical protein